MSTITTSTLPVCSSSSSSTIAIAPSTSSSLSKFPSHSHTRICPYADTMVDKAKPTHEYCPRQEGDSRSPCPALNALANHGYLPRDGRKIDPDTLEKALIDAFQISHTFAYLLAHGGKFMLGQKGDTFSLEDLARHNIVEHDASLFHADAGSRDEYAPNHPDQVMVRTVLKESSDGSTMSPDNFVAARVKRDSCYEGGPKLDLVHHEIAIGEMGLVLTIFGTPTPPSTPNSSAFLKNGVTGTVDRPVSFLSQPKSFLARILKYIWSILFGTSTTPPPPPVAVSNDHLRTLIEEERIPEGWKPVKSTGLTDAYKMVSMLKKKIKEQQEQTKKQ